MSGASVVERANVESTSDRVSVPLVVVAAILCGLGLLGTAYWLVTLNWILFPSILLVALGAYLLFTRATGPERA
jgi:Na+/proline symporter